MNRSFSNRTFSIPYLCGNLHSFAAKLSTSSPKAKVTVNTKWLGMVTYAEGLRIQQQHINAHLSEGHDCTENKNTLLLLEHRPVYTVGIRDASYSEEVKLNLKKIGADFCKTDRGGLITFHGPGQLVAYPILDLQHFGKAGKVAWYVQNLENTLIDLCQKYGIRAAKSSCYPGVWTGESLERKLAAIGIHVRNKRITSHGLALNCNTDLKWFDYIVPCGLTGKTVTSLSEELQREISVVEILKPFCESFAKLFDCVLQNSCGLEINRKFTN